MRIYRGQVPTISEEIVDALLKEQAIEVLPEYVNEVQLDVESVINEYRRIDRDVMERAKDAVANRNLDYSQLSKVRQRLADQKGFGTGDKAIDWLLKQLIEVLLHSRNVEEVFAADHELRRTMHQVLKRYSETDRDLDRQVRARIKNLQEGSNNWDVEYQRVMGDLRQRKGLGE
jgi:hypothetical protein